MRINLIFQKSQLAYQILVLKEVSVLLFLHPLFEQFNGSSKKGNTKRRDCEVKIVKLPERIFFEQIGMINWQIYIVIDKLIGYGCYYSQCNKKKRKIQISFFEKQGQQCIYQNIGNNNINRQKIECTFQ